MLIFCDKAIEYSTAGTVYIAYDSPPTCAVYDMSGGLIEAGLASAVCPQETDTYQADTTDALYAHEALYRPRWTMTLNGTTYSVDGSPYEHIATAITPPPDPPGIAVQSWTDTSVTVAHVPPADAGYTSTTVFAVLVPGDGVTAPVTASGSGTTITVTGLQSGRSYILVALAYGTGGNASVIGMSSVGAGQAWPADSPALPLLVKCFVNQEAIPRKVYALDPTLVDGNDAGATNFELRPNTRGRTHRIRLECDAPVMVKLRSLGGVFQVRDGEVGGLKGIAGN